MDLLDMYREFTKHILTDYDVDDNIKQEAKDILDKDFKHFQKTDRKDFLLSKYRYLRNQNSINEASTGISLGSVDEALKYDLIERE